MHICVAANPETDAMDCSDDTHVAGDAPSTTPPPSRATVHAVRRLLQWHALDVQDRARHFQHHLLAACVGFVLALPPVLIFANLQQFLPTLQTALRVGVGFPPLASAGECAQAGVNV